VEVDALDAISVDTLLHRVLGAPLDGAAEAQLLEISGGNPLFLRELVLGAIGEGTLRELDGVWRLDGQLAPSRSLGDRVLGRVEALAGDARAALELVAVAEPIGLADLESVVDPSVLEDLEARGLLRVESDRRRNDVRLAHPVYGEILRNQLGRVGLRRVAREQAERVQRHGARRRDDALRIARWQVDAGITPDPDVVLAGARVARHHSDWTTTMALANAALEGGAQAAAPLLAEAHFELGDFGRVREVAEAALDVGPPDETAFAQLRRILAGALFWGYDLFEEALDILTETEASVADVELKELMRFYRASLLAWSGKRNEALQLVEPMVASLEPRVAVQAALVVELATLASGPTTRTIELADECFPIHLGITDLAGIANPGNHLVTKAVALTTAGRVDEAHALAEFGYGASVKNRTLIGQMWFSLELGRIALMRGDANTAVRWFREQIALCRDTGHRRPVTIGLSGVAVAYAYLGDAAGARGAINELDETPSAFIALFGVEDARARAWADAVEGNVSAARERLVAAAEAAEANGLTLMGALARFDALRLGDREQSDALAAAAATCASRAIDLAAEWAAAGNDGARLDAVADEFETIGCLLFAAEAAATAATAWENAGERRHATASEQRAQELARRCHGVSTPALTIVDTVVPLTPRELEIAVLVAQGLSSKDVAARLFVSARTVSNHLQSAYTKLGITKRSELADALGRLGEGDA
jgi:DNA-binding NarL/FixJ family response regulator